MKEAEKKDRYRKASINEGCKGCAYIAFYPDIPPCTQCTRRVNGKDCYRRREEESGEGV